MNGSDPSEKYFKTQCEKANSTQFMKYNYGVFYYDSLSTPPPSNNEVINIGYFPFNISLPHFEREIVIDTLYLRSNLTKNIVYNIDGNDILAFQLTGNQSALNYPCSNLNQNLTIQQFFRARFYQNQTINNYSLTVRVSEQMENNTYLQSLLLSSLQVNINTCHPSCLTCFGPNKDQCLSCSEQSIPSNPQIQCNCSNLNQFFQNGKCVNQCDISNGYFQKFQSEKVCYYINNKCTQWNNTLQKCDKCQNPLLPQIESCVNQCSAGYQKLQIAKTISFECVYIDRNKQGYQILLSGLHNNFFSQIEIERLGFTFSGFKQINNFSAIQSNCGGYQLFGGFFINKKGSTIQYLKQQISTGHKLVKVYFKYFLIDYQNSQESQIQIWLNDQNVQIQLNQAQISTSQNVCGLDRNDIIGDFQTITNLINNQVNLTIINSNQYSDDSNYNNITYFGIREVTILLLNCNLDFCSECSLDAFSQCTKCIDGYYLVSGNCKQCDLSCQTCSSAQKCDTCKDANAQKNKNDICVCPSKQYFDLFLLACTSCQNNLCDQCKQDNSQICTSCSDQRGLLNGQCLTDCGKEYFNKQNVCTPCVDNCLECVDESSCKTCKVGYFQLNTCVETCPEAYFQNTQTNTCDKCDDSNCLMCNQSPQKCTKCKDPYLVSTLFKCENECQQFIEYNNNGICELCTNKISNCLSCQQETCIKCVDKFYLSQDKKQCLQECPIQQIGVNSTGLCTSCAEGCTKCEQNDQTICSSCIKGYFFENNKCQKNCESVNFADETSNQCLPCNLKYSQCQECDINNCKSCNNLYLDISSSRCIGKCEQGQYYSKLKNQCQNCQDPNCYSCKDSDPNQCIDCKYTFAGRYYLYKGKCYEQCPDNSYILPPDKQQSREQKECGDCYDYDPQCTSCTSNMCTMCNTGYCLDISTGKCIKNITNQCPIMTCKDDNCLKCDSNGKCTDCKKQYFLLDDQCSKQCNKGYYNDTSNNKCIDCKTYLGKNCISCTITYCLETDCTQEKQFYNRNLKDKETQCVNNCPDNFYPDKNGICQWCHNYNCKGCDPKQPANCTSCFEKKYNINYLLQDSKCVSICSKGFYLSQAQAICKPCQSECLTCTENECLECKDSKKYINPLDQNCVDQCLPNYFPGPNKNNKQQCMSCSQLFDGCQDCDSNQCIKCVDTKQVFDPVSKKCSQSCPIQYYQIEQQCKKCDNSNCQKCDSNNPKKCISCFQQGKFVLLQEEEGNCVERCSDNEYQQDSKCIKCSKNFGEKCSKCNNKKCITCSDPTFFINIFVDFSCVSPCPTGQYGDSATGKCSKCKNDKCNQCDLKNTTECISCNITSQYPYLHQKNCIVHCPQQFYFDDQNACQSCQMKYDSNCIECDKTNCTKCDIKSNYIYLQKDQNKCVKQCSDKYYTSNDKNTLQCLICPDNNCLKCDPNEPIKCQKCASGFYFNQSKQKCANQCEKDQYGDDSLGLCMYCNIKFSNCDECTNSECLRCQKDYFKVDGQQNCYKQCPFNTIDKILVNPNYDMSKNKQCEKCQNANCAVCDPKDLKICQSCSEEKQLPYLYKNDCIKQCNQYQKEDIKYCYDQCPKKLAQDEKTKKCIECPKFVQNNECVNECKKSTYINPELPNVCEDCEIQYSKNCSICDINQCKQCSNQNYLYENKCFEQCPQKTYIQENQMTCSNNCDPPLVIQDRTCQKKCLSGYFIVRLNGHQVCQKCSNQCKECEKTSDTCTECFEGEEQDCFNQKSIKFQTEKLICKQLNEQDLDKCEESIYEQSQTVAIFSYAVQISLLFYLLVILLSHSFNSTLSLFYLQNFQMLANYAILTSNKFQLIKEMALRFLLNYNVFQMIPNPFQNDKNSQKLTNFSLFESILPYSNLSKSSFENVFFQVCIIFVMIILIIVTIKSKNNQRIMQYFRNNFFIKIFMISSNLILLSCLKQLYQQQFYGSIDISFLVVSISLYAILWSLMFIQIINYQIQSSLQRKFYQKNILIQNLVYISIFRRIFWVFYEIKKIVSICFIILYPQNDNAVWVILPFNLIFLIYVSVYRPFEQKYQTLCISAVEIFTIILLTYLPFSNSIESTTGKQTLIIKILNQLILKYIVFIYLAIFFQCISGLAILILTLKSSYKKLRSCKFSFKNTKKIPKQKDISLEINNSLSYQNNTTQSNLNINKIKMSFMPKANCKQ
ncbi:zinc finger lsd1 subclass family protein (macronuclear) [Tetrahymena thermophila SB210]|uniref:Zinc finger lsd1 subclass family protein n=1 Tax=Tetrahymena thermophila (strain SB210) TaxID=312017 RepID=I7M0Q5_TETTS|nr:zinc finger lsd1 subclass family protein [Tetrahymena thermophila SB210]EAR90744.2 zinc finger lsd1 subclass family protein [Tetrahymena thermophila SB210]|eukprot:XP_001010989.2 zinc finger lsd1 subclass family protein [Tetrahymena thermophila SB210]